MIASLFCHSNHQLDSPEYFYMVTAEYSVIMCRILVTVKYLMSIYCNWRILDRTAGAGTLKVLSCL